MPLCLSHSKGAAAAAQLSCVSCGFSLHLQPVASELVGARWGGDAPAEASQTLASSWDPNAPVALAGTWNAAMGGGGVSSAPTATRLGQGRACTPTEGHMEGAQCLGEGCSVVPGTHSHDIAAGTFAVAPGRGRLGWQCPGGWCSAAAAAAELALGCPGSPQHGRVVQAGMAIVPLVVKCLPQGFRVPAGHHGVGLGTLSPCQGSAGPPCTPDSPTTPGRAGRTAVQGQRRPLGGTSTRV